MGYGFKQGGTLKITKVKKPSLSSVSFVYNREMQHIDVVGFDSDTMSILPSSETSGTNADTYTVTVRLAKHCKWEDGTKDDINLLWTIDKLRIKKPTVSGEYVFVGGVTRYADVHDFDPEWMEQSGVASSTEFGDYTLNWSLNDKNNTCWADGSIEDLIGVWSVVWVNGQSHYANDLYNSGWRSGALLAQMSGVTWMADRVALKGNSTAGGYAMLQSSGTYPNGTRMYMNVRSLGGQAVIGYSTIDNTSRIKQIAATSDAAFVNIGGAAGGVGFLSVSTYNSAEVRRIWTE